MYLVFENTKQSYQFPENMELLVGNDSECDVQISHPQIMARHFLIVQKSYGCVLKTFNAQVKLNGMKIQEQCLLDTGDLISVDDLNFRLLDDKYIPKNSPINYTNAPLNRPTNTTSVYGLRSFSPASTGRFIIDSYHHADGWHVIRKENELHLIDNKNKTLLNGLKIAQARLSNGDVISNDKYKYRVELPGTSGFSKFSPSHPRNVQLSESMSSSTDSHLTVSETNKQTFFKNNLWWITLAVGLVVLVFLILNNPST